MGAYITYKTKIINRNLLPIKGLFGLVKCKYIICRIFSNMNLIRKCNILAYNYQLLKITDTTPKQSRTIPITKIELNINNNFNHKFINMKYNESLYYIYFDNSVEVHHIDTYKYGEVLKKITIYINYKVRSLAKLFQNCVCIDNVSFERMQNPDYEDFNSMFHGCINLKSIKFNSINTINVKNMSAMFFECNNLKNIDLSLFDTNNVLYMNYMFAECKALQILDLSNISMKNLIEANHMFYKCSALKNIIFSNITTKKLQYMAHMFHGCEQLININLSSFKLNKVRYINHLCQNCFNYLTAAGR